MAATLRIDFCTSAAGGRQGRGRGFVRLGLEGFRTERLKGLKDEKAGSLQLGNIQVPFNGNQKLG